MSEETKHTPGPWSLQTVETSSGKCHKIGPFPPASEGGKLRHACLYADYPSEYNPANQELLANARLIAAAPELLEALKSMTALMANGCGQLARLPFTWRELFAQSEAAIAKAEGRAA